MPTIKLQQVKNFDKLLKYLETELGWPVEGREIDDIAFPFDLEADLGLDKNEVAKVRHVYRLKKMHKKQPFGIFFVDFEGKKMPVSVLKRILRNLALKRKANAKAADQLAWDVEDLIFISAVGEEKDSTREISFAHFRKEPDNRHVLKVMAWDGGDTPLKMDHLDDVLHECLRFPDDTNDVDAWRKSWTAAFRTGLRQNIRRSEELAQALAALAMRINKEALSLIKKESANGPLKTLHAGFKDALIHDLTEEAFTDCYAQTITYGLLTAAITKVNQAGVKDLTSTSVLEMVPSTNPFLKDILSSFLEAGGRGQKGIDFDDLGVQDVIDLLRAESTDLPNILRDFGNLTQDEDPVIHFYETFLKIYNKDERVKRGAFYTPRPVVSYIVRSVDELLRKEFGLEDGLADTTTWGEMIKRNPAIKLPPLTDNPGEKKTIKESEPFVQILDPATGTATFLVEVINIIEKTVKAKAWAKLKNGPYDHDQHSKREEVLKIWNEYVPEHLLKRLHAYELMMAPYVIAHMKVGLKLAETGYRFATEERARIYLTNALDTAKGFNDRLNFDIPALAIEAKQVNEIKKNKRFTVIVGNPPYSYMSGNLNADAAGLIDRFRYVDGEKIKERSALSLERSLQDDFVKFFGLALSVADKTGSALVLGLITNNSYIDSALHRGVRDQLTKTFNYLYIVNLFGDSIKDKEENVFDIQQGVAIFLGTRHSALSNKTFISNIHGTREEKYEIMAKDDWGSTRFDEITIRAPQRYFMKLESGGEYLDMISLEEVFRISSTCIKTLKDDLATNFNKEELVKNIEFFRNPGTTPTQIKQLFGVEDVVQWKIEPSRRELKNLDIGKYVKKYQARPFDYRWMFYHKSIVGSPREEVMRNLGKETNLALIANRKIRTGDCNHFWVTSDICVSEIISSADNSNCYPLYILADQEGLALTGQCTNFSRKFLEAVALRLGKEIPIGQEMPEGITPEGLFSYMYAVFHSRTYRTRYADHLKIEFPRVAITSNIKLFKELEKLGGELTSLHLLRKDADLGRVAVFIGNRGQLIGRPKWSDGKIWINEDGPASFDDIAEDVWNFQIGSYRVCEKWLKDRKGKKLSKAEIECYGVMLSSISKTVKLMDKVDKAINGHEGWPKAFQ